MTYLLVLVFLNSPVTVTGAGSIPNTMVYARTDDFGMCVKLATMFNEKKTPDGRVAVCVAQSK